MSVKTEKMRNWVVTHPKWCYVGKVPKHIFENSNKKKIINFQAFLVGKVPKIDVFNRECLETSENWNWI